MFDSVDGFISVTESKLTSARERAVSVLELDQQRLLTARVLAQAAGLLCHVGEVDLQLRRRLHSAWADLNAAGV